MANLNGHALVGFLKVGYVENVQQFVEDDVISIHRSTSSFTFQLEDFVRLA